MTTEPRTETWVLVAALRELARTIASDDGVANAAIGEAADRLEQQATDILELRLALAGMLTTLDMLSTAGEKKYAFVESRRGSMVCVAPDMDHARSLLDRIK